MSSEKFTDYWWPKPVTDPKKRAESLAEFGGPTPEEERQWVGNRCVELMEAGEHYDTDELHEEYRRLKAEGKL